VILRASLVLTDTEMAEKYAKQQQPAVCGIGLSSCSEDMPQDVLALMGLVTLTFDLETGMRVASKVGNFHSEFGHARPLGSRVRPIRYIRDGQTDGQTDGWTKATLTAPSLRTGA